MIESTGSQIEPTENKVESTGSTVELAERKSSGWVNVWGGRSKEGRISPQILS